MVEYEWEPESRNDVFTYIEIEKERRWREIGEEEEEEKRKIEYANSEVSNEKNKFRNYQSAY